MHFKVAALVMLGGHEYMVVSFHVKENQEIRQYTESGWPSSGSSWQIMLHYIHSWNHY